MGYTFIHSHSIVAITDLILGPPKWDCLPTHLRVVKFEIRRKEKARRKVENKIKGVFGHKSPFYVAKEIDFGFL